MPYASCGHHVVLLCFFGSIMCLRRKMGNTHETLHSTSCPFLYSFAATRTHTIHKQVGVHVHMHAVAQPARGVPGRDTSSSAMTAVCPPVPQVHRSSRNGSGGSSSCSNCTMTSNKAQVCCSRCRVETQRSNSQSEPHATPPTQSPVRNTVCIWS